VGELLHSDGRTLPTVHFALCLLRTELALGLWSAKDLLHPPKAEMETISPTQLFAAELIRVKVNVFASYCSGGSSIIQSWKWES